jgi:hypothetical protein
VIAIDTLLPDLIVEVAGCPDFTAHQAVLYAAIEFCEKSDAWAIECDPDTQSTGDPYYPIPVPSSANLVQVLEFYYNGNRLEPTPPDRLRYYFQNWMTASADTTTYYVDGTNVRLVPIPIADNPVQVRVSLKPSRTASYLDSNLYEKYWDELRCGALARIMGQKGHVWSDPDMAAQNRERFLVGIDHARISALRGGAHVSLEVTPRTFGLT